MIDFIQATLTIEGKDSPFFGNLQPIYENRSGMAFETKAGCKKMRIFYNRVLNSITIEGSPMYFMQGHNLTFDRLTLIQGINYLETILCVQGLWSARVNIFEYGVLLQTELTPREYIKHHKSPPKEKLLLYENTKDNGLFRSWNDSNVNIKMYDAIRNAKYKTSKDIRPDMDMSRNANWLKFEAHYIKPECLNSGRAVLLADLINPNWEQVFKNDLYKQYSRLKPMKTLLEPTNKADLSSIAIVTMELAENFIQEGRGLEDLRRSLYDRINANEVLSKADKDSRKRQIRNTLDKLKEAPQSKYDLSKELASALEL